MNVPLKELKNAHDHSMYNSAEVMASEVAGCFCCRQQKARSKV